MKKATTLLFIIFCTLAVQALAISRYYSASINKNLKHSNLPTIISEAAPITIPTLNAPNTKPAWKDIQTWGVQYQKFNKDDLSEIAHTALDLVALGRLDGWGQEWLRANILKTKKNKWLIAYISAGQLQPHEWYWQKSWFKNPPIWQLPAVTRFGSYNVKYWDPQWQKLVFQTIDRIIKSGFDGMFIDQADPYWNFGFPGKASIENRLRSKDLVCAMSKYARAKQTGFRIITNGTADLLDFEGFAQCVDGIAAEHLWFKDSGVPGDPGYREFVLNQLPKALRLNLKVFTFDYTQVETEHAYVLEQATQRGFISFTGEPGLKTAPKVR